MPLCNLHHGRDFPGLGLILRMTSLTFPLLPLQRILIAVASSVEDAMFHRDVVAVSAIARQFPALGANRTSSSTATLQTNALSLPPKISTSHRSLSLRYRFTLNALETVNASAGRRVRGLRARRVAPKWC